MTETCHTDDTLGVRPEGWLARQIRLAQESLAELPEWARRAARLEGGEVEHDDV